MSAWFIKSRTQRKPHVISTALRSSVSTLYQTACGQVVRYRTDFEPAVHVFEPTEVKPDDVCGICRAKTKQEIAA